MKLFPIFLTGISSQIVREYLAEDGSDPPEDFGVRAVKPRHPKKRMNTLIRFSQEILDENFGFWSRQATFKNNFRRIGQKMLNSFDRCGSYDGDAPDPDDSDNSDQTRTDDRYNKSDPCKASKQLTTGYRKWAEKYLVNCVGQKSKDHITAKMNKARVILLKALTKRALCKENLAEFTKPEKGKIIQKFKSLGQDWKLSFEIKPTSISNGWTNILFSTTASAKEGVNVKYKLENYFVRQYIKRLTP